jgi:glycosyltransferase involved in cell wall biosynthesis
MACGTPVVATARAAEGIDARDGVHLRIADDGEAFADAIAGLLCDRDAASRLADEAYRLVATRYGWPSSVAALEAVYAEIAGPCASSGS